MNVPDNGATGSDKARRLLRITPRGALLAVLVLFQLICATVFVADVFSALLGLRAMPLPWAQRELIELAAAVGLLAGLGLGAAALFRALHERDSARAQLSLAQTGFHQLLQIRFAEWGLTAAERDVALFAIKGMSTAEIALLRGTSEGTVKAQTNAIYRKAGVSGRPQLLGLLLDDLTGTVSSPAPKAERRAS